MIQISLGGDARAFIMPHFLRTGYYNRSHGYIASHITEGSWWSTTSSSTTNALYLLTEHANVMPQRSHYRGFGFAVRCVVREG